MFLKSMRVKKLLSVKRRSHMTIGMTTGMHTGLQTRLRNNVYVFGHAHLHVYDAVSAACRWKRSTRSNITTNRPLGDQR